MYWVSIADHFLQVTALFGSLSRNRTGGVGGSPVNVTMSLSRMYSRGCLRTRFGFLGQSTPPNNGSRFRSSVGRSTTLRQQDDNSGHRDRDFSTTYNGFCHFYLFPGHFAQFGWDWENFSLPFLSNFVFSVSFHSHAPVHVNLREILAILSQAKYWTNGRECLFRTLRIV